MKLTHSLNLNKHPNEIENNSFVDARNIKVDNDLSHITNEESIDFNYIIVDSFRAFFDDSQTEFVIAGCIPCNKELVIIVLDENDIGHIFRYNEKANECRRVYSGLVCSNNVIGTYTYNIEESLIISISSIGRDDIPLKTINLGNFNDSNIINDLQIVDDVLSLSPKIIIPKLDDLQYIKGSAFKGWYYIFIQYKINSVDYTQWYNIGNPIYLDSLETKQIIRYCYDQTYTGTSEALFASNAEGFDDGYCVGCSDDISSEQDLAETTIKFNIIDNDPKFNTCRIGLICRNKSYSKTYISSDIKFENDIEFIINYNTLFEYDEQALIKNNYNYYGVKNIINYNNRLYISNYKEVNINKNLSEFSNKVGVKLNTVKYSPNIIRNNTPLAYNIEDTNNPSQYKTTTNIIKFNEFLNIDEQTLITIKGIDTRGGTSTTTTQSFFIEIHPKEENSINTCIIKIVHPAYNITLVDDIEYTINDIVYIFPTNDYSILGNNKYIDVNIDFTDRLKNTSLIPGEVYNFFIHYVDEYGVASNGLKLNNTNRYKRVIDVASGVLEYVLPIEVVVDNYTYYVIYKDDIKFNNIELANCIVATGINMPAISDVDTINACKDAVFNKYISIINNENLNNIYVANIINSSCYNLFGVFINSNDEELFRIPDCKNTNDSLEYDINRLVVENIELPEGYVGYFISYEKFEPIKKEVGVLSRNDFRIKQVNDVESISNLNKSNSMYFYTSGYDIDDSISLDYNFIKLIGKDNFDKDEIKDYNYVQRNKFIKYPYDCNKAQINNTSIDEIVIPLTDYNLRVADSIVDDRIGKSTVLEINDVQGLFDSILYYDYDETSMLQYSNSIRTYYNNIIQLSAFLPDTGIRNAATTGSNMNYELYLALESKSYLSNIVSLYETSKDYYDETVTKEYNESLPYAESVLNPTNLALYKESYLQIRNNLNAFSLMLQLQTPKNYYANLYIAELYNINSSIYTSNNKVLYRLSDIIYGNENVTITTGYNGRLTCDSMLIYDSAGVIFNNGDFSVRRISNNSKYYPDKYDGDELTRPFINYIQWMYMSTIVNESKSFNNAPANYMFPIKGVNETDEDNKSYAPGCLVEARNSTDLFKNKQGDSDSFNPMFYSNYRDDIVNVTEYNKTIRRSSVIQDESRVNAWRTFDIEGYKIISENKGDITNLVGIGYFLLVHTEHSLFMFDKNNMLRTDEQNIQLQQVDIFNVDYKEVLTSDKGYGGLQSNKSAVVDQFGYIFYDNTYKRLYRFDNGSLSVISDNIKNWLSKNNITDLFIANDKRNKRLLLNFEIDNNNYELISYNYQLNRFISTHDYIITKAYNTEYELYIINDYAIQQFVKNRYGDVSNSMINRVKIPEVSGSGYTNLDAYVSIIHNEDYESVKFLEYIKYKLNKVSEDNKSEYDNSPVEELITYSGDELTIFNHNTNSGIRDINVESINRYNAYTFPYYELDNWNFSYFRDINNNATKRLYGNYFILKFNFKNTDRNKIEFYSLQCIISKNRIL